MRPLLLKGHERPLTYIKYNHEGDLFVSCAKDKHPTLWHADSGQRVGTYLGHDGATWTCDISRDSKHLYTGSADSSVRMWTCRRARSCSSGTTSCPAAPWSSRWASSSCC